MSRLKRFAVGTGLTLVLLGAAVPLWYRSHYVAPLATTPAQLLPSPNGYNALHEALNLLPQVLNAKFYLFPDRYSLAERQQLLAGQQLCLTKTREAVQQEYLVPRGVGIISPSEYHEHQALLLFATETYEDSGNLVEAMQCALDAMELGVIIPRGGEFITRQTGNQYEMRGRQLAWRLVGRVDAKTAHQAVARLPQIDKRRWPVAESLREDLRYINANYTVPEFKEGPVYAWEKTSFERAGSTSATFRSLWSRIKTVYYGPKVFIDATEECVKRAKERFDQPWQPDRPELNSDVLRAHYDFYGYSNLEMEEYFHRAQCVLLRTSFALRAYRLEKGSNPASLEQLVAAGYLPALPIDPFSPTRAPLRYQPDGLLWSIGPDAEDNGGQTKRETGGSKTGRFPSGDVVPNASLLATYFYS